MLEEFSRCTEDVSKFLRPQPELEESIKSQLKSVYALTKKCEDYRKENNSTLSKLITNEFDVEQIWQQIQIQNEFACDEIYKRLSTYLVEARKSDEPHSDDQESENIDESDADEEDSEIEVSSPDTDTEKYPENGDVVQKKTVRFDLEEKNDPTTNGRRSLLIEKLEKKALEEKPWQLTGEVSAKTRPENSLLEEYLEFDVTTRPVPVITEEAAQKLEDVILRRIKDKAWDDVERKIKPVGKTPYEFKTQLVLDQEKSKVGLAQIYEQEYLKQKEAVDPANKFRDEEIPKEHKQITNLLDSLFRKLDALSNYHYTPVPAAPELQIVNNLPAISLEEAIPAAVSDAVLLAPEEIQGKTLGELKSKEERNKTDKKRARRRKKLKQKLRKKAIGDIKKPKKNSEKKKKLKNKII